VADSLPVLDAEPDAFRADLRRAAHEVGFFQLVGHGVPRELTRELVAVSRRFFSLPAEDKLAIENIRSPQFRGYTRIGGERTHGDVDWREQIDISVERPAIEPVDGVPDYRRLEGPNLWPEALPELRPIVRYPGATAPDRGQGVGAHRDGGVLTLLLVEPGKAGLQVEHHGTWIDVVPEPGAFVVNIGEMLELATGGYLRATLHRVVAPPPGTDRISVPFLFNPALDTRMPASRSPRSSLPGPVACRSTPRTARSSTSTGRTRSATGSGPPGRRRDPSPRPAAAGDDPTSDGCRALGFRPCSSSRVVGPDPDTSTAVPSGTAAQEKPCDTPHPSSTSSGAHRSCG
jgi:isopenicillin N synthase-like dioxygenase